MIARDLEKENDIPNMEEKVEIINRAFGELKGESFADYSLEKVSKSVYLSQTNFSRIFKETTNKRKFFLNLQNFYKKLV